MSELLTYALLVFTSFFTLINPLGTMPVFMTMTKPLTSAERRNTAIKAVVVALVALLLFAFSGNLLFDFFGISVNSFRMVGGVIFFLMGMDMLQARLASTKVAADQSKEYVDDISVTPLGIPMICGPGAITNAIVLMRDTNSIAEKLTLVGVMVAVLGLTLLIFLSSTKILKIIGETGNKVMMRLMGLIVMVIAVEFFFSGLKPVLVDIFREVSY